MEKTAQTLTDILSENHWKQTDLAERSGLSHTLLSRLLNRKKQLSFDTLAAIIEHLPSPEQQNRLGRAILQDHAQRLGLDSGCVYYDCALRDNAIHQDELPWLSQVAAAARDNKQFKKTVQTTLEILSMTETQFKKMVAEAQAGYQTEENDRPT